MPGLCCWVNGGQNLVNNQDWKEASKSEKEQPPTSLADSNQILWFTNDTTVGLY